MLINLVGSITAHMSEIFGCHTSASVKRRVVSDKLKTKTWPSESDFGSDSKVSNGFVGHSAPLTLGRSQKWFASLKNPGLFRKHHITGTVHRKRKQTSSSYDEVRVSSVQLVMKLEYIMWRYMKQNLIRQVFRRICSRNSGCRMWVDSKLWRPTWISVATKCMDVKKILEKRCL